MLQRAASNAYSWWWASHIRTKQSKWLEQCLQDMEEQIQSMLSLIEGDGDSFAKRAEMYYKRRPELVLSVEEAYKTFRSLADRYDMMSKDLQNANHTIAKVFPDQCQFGFDDDDEFSMSNFPIDGPQPPPSPSASGTPKNVPPEAPRMPPKLPNKDLKRAMSSAAKQLRPKKSSRGRSLSMKRADEVKSGLTKDEASEEINRLQKEILSLQTVKEFVKSSYENGVSQYWDIENRITTIQERVSSLQDEFNIGSVIEDDEARMLMLEAALKSCQETLTALKEKQDKADREAKEEEERIQYACQRLLSIRRQYLPEETIEENPGIEHDGNDTQNSSDLSKVAETEPEKVRKGVELSFIANMTVTQMAERIDELVSKVFGLETSMLSQAMLVNSLKGEIDDLNSQIRVLDDKKGNVEKLKNKVSKVQEKMNKIQDLNKNVKWERSNLESNFVEARTSLGCLSENLSNIKPDEEVLDESNSTTQSDVTSWLDQDSDDRMDVSPPIEDATKNATQADVIAKDSHAYEPQEVQVEKEIRKLGSLLLDRRMKEVRAKADSPDDPNSKDHTQENVEESEEMIWQQMLLTGVENHEKILMKEYTSLLRNYRDLKRKLSEVEKDERENEFDLTLQMRELKKAMTKKDEENRYLREKLMSLSPNMNAEEAMDTTTATSTQDKVDENNTETQIKSIQLSKLPTLTTVEAKIRSQIDMILEENLEFWLSFSTAIREVQKFKTEVQDLQDEASKISTEKKHRDSSKSSSSSSSTTTTSSVKKCTPEAKAIYKHLKEIQRELSVWLDQSVQMKEELKTRFTSLCNIQEEITRALKEGVQEEEIKFGSHQAAKFQGEIMNMKQENNRVRQELQAALDLVRLLQIEIDKLLSQLTQEYGVGNEQNQENSTRPKVPLRSLLFGGKKPKASFFSCIQPYKKYPGGRKQTND